MLKVVRKKEKPKYVELDKKDHVLRLLKSFSPLDCKMLALMLGTKRRVVRSIIKKLIKGELDLLISLVFLVYKI